MTLAPYISRVGPVRTRRSGTGAGRLQLDVQRSAFNVQRSTFNVQRPTSNVQRSTPAPRGWRAFTLLEVMIAMAIFFMAIFAILGLVSQNLQIARGLSLGEIDVSTVAVELTLQTLTNREMSEGYISGDFGETFPGATWGANLFLVSSNAGGLATRSSGGGLYQADITITWPQNRLLKERQTSLLLYRPNLGSRMGGR